MKITCSALSIPDMNVQVVFSRVAAPDGMHTRHSTHLARLTRAAVVRRLITSCSHRAWLGSLPTCNTSSHHSSCDPLAYEGRSLLGTYRRADLSRGWVSSEQACWVPAHGYHTSERTGCYSWFWTSCWSERCDAWRPCHQRLWVRERYWPGWWLWLPQRWKVSHPTEQQRRSL